MAEDMHPAWLPYLSVILMCCDTWVLMYILCHSAFTFLYDMLKPVGGLPIGVHRNAIQLHH